MLGTFATPETEKERITWLTQELQGLLQAGLVPDDGHGRIDSLSGHDS